MSQNNTNTILPVPADITDPDQIAGGEDRWANCPLKDCKRDADLLYEDFYLRGIRSNRLMCSQCAVRVEMGYMAREEVKKSDDRFFTGSQADNAIVFGVMLAGSIVANVIMLFIGFWILAIFLGAGVGATIATYARRLAQGRITRQMPYYAIAGIVVGALLAPTVYIFLTFGFLTFAPTFNIFITLVTSVAMGSGAWGIFLRRI